MCERSHCAALTMQYCGPLCCMKCSVFLDKYFFPDCTAVTYHLDLIIVNCAALYVRLNDCTEYAMFFNRKLLSSRPRHYNNYIFTKYSNFSASKILRLVKIQKDQQYSTSINSIIIPHAVIQQFQRRQLPEARPSSLL